MSGNWKGKTVFILDDSPLMRSQNKKAFEELGFKVVGEAAHGLEALEKLAGLNPDLISIDLMMPVMHGVEFYRRLKAERDFRFVFVSALNSDYRTKEAFAEEIDPIHFLNKPLNKTQLQNALEHVFSAPEQSSQTPPMLDGLTAAG